jgi:hypothetical protein
MSDNSTLREHLMDVVQGLKEKKIELDRAKAISDVAQTLINLAKVEVDYMKVTGAIVDDGIIKALPAPGKSTHQTLTGVKQTESIPGGSVTTHRLR